MESTTARSSPWWKEAEADNSAFSLMKISPDATIEVEGFIQQESYRWLR